VAGAALAFGYAVLTNRTRGELPEANESSEEIDEEFAEETAAASPGPSKDEPALTGDREEGDYADKP
jgi:hypothetical protein